MADYYRPYNFDHPRSATYCRSRRKKSRNRRERSRCDRKDTCQKKVRNCRRENKEKTESTVITHSFLPINNILPLFQTLRQVGWRWIPERQEYLILGEEEIAADTSHSNTKKRNHRKGKKCPKPPARRRFLYNPVLHTASGTAPLKIRAVVNRGATTEQKIEGVQGLLNSSFVLNVDDRVSFDVATSFFIPARSNTYRGFGPCRFNTNGTFSSLGTDLTDRANRFAIFDNTAQAYTPYERIPPPRVESLNCQAQSALSANALDWVVGQPCSSFSGSFHSARASAQNSTMVLEESVPGPFISNFVTVEFGASIDISDDGLTVVVGAPGSILQSPNLQEVGLFAVYQFDTVEFKFIAGQGGSTPTAFGRTGQSVSISRDGKVIAIASPAPQGIVGRVDTYFLDGSSLQLFATIQGKFGSINFGGSIQLNKDGTVLVINQSSLRSVIAFFFRRSGTNWIQERSVEIFPPPEIDRAIGAGGNLE